MADVTVTTNEGIKWLQGILLGLVYYGAWGSGSGTVAKTDTALFQEETEARTEAKNTKSSDDTIQFTWAQTAVASKTITEAGLFDDPVAGLCDYHAVFEGIALSCGDSIGFALSDTLL